LAQLCGVSTERVKVLSAGEGNLLPRASIEHIENLAEKTAKGIIETQSKAFDHFDAQSSRAPLRVPSLGEVMMLEQKKFHRVLEISIMPNRIEVSGGKVICCEACLMFINHSDSEMIICNKCCHPPHSDSNPSSRPYVVHKKCLEAMHLEIESKTLMKKHHMCPDNESKS